MANFENIGETPLFATCPLDERKLLASLRVPLRVAAGNDIVEQGTFGETIGAILEGQASVWRDGVHLADLTEGDCFGELALLAMPSEGGQRTASIRADTEVRVDTVNRADLNAELSQLPSVAAVLRELGANNAP